MGQQLAPASELAPTAEVASASPGAPGRGRTRLVVLLLALLSGPFLAEGLLRWLLFSPSALAERLGARFREPGLYVATPNSDDYTKLYSLFLIGSRMRPGVPPFADAELGWIKAGIDPVTYRHARESELAGRRPVLFYGSSFGACAGHLDGGCFEELLEGAELGREYCLLNYAVSGHGVDQSVLLLRKTIDLYAALDPVVVLAFVLETDMDRASLSFCTRPKPRFHPRGDEFVLEPPDELDLQAYHERHPPAISSYFWRYLVNNVGGLALETRRRWGGEPDRHGVLENIAGFLLSEFGRECSERGLEHFVLLFHTRTALESTPPQGARDAQAMMARLGLPLVDSRADVERALASRECTLVDLFGNGAHPSGRGTELLQRALERGLRHELDGGR